MSLNMIIPYNLARVAVNTSTNTLLVALPYHLQMLFLSTCLALCLSVYTQDDPPRSGGGVEETHVAPTPTRTSFAYDSQQTTRGIRRPAPPQWAHTWLDRERPRPRMRGTVPMDPSIRALAIFRERLHDPTRLSQLSTFMQRMIVIEHEQSLEALLQLLHQHNMHLSAHMGCSITLNVQVAATTDDD